MAALFFPQGPASEASSRSLTPVYPADGHPIEVNNFFAWDDLRRELSTYKLRVLEDWDDCDEGRAAPYVQFCEELQGWLDNPISAELPARESLEMWRDSVDSFRTDQNSPLFELLPILIIDRASV